MAIGSSPTRSTLTSPAQSAPYQVTGSDADCIRNKMEFYLSVSKQIGVLADGELKRLHSGASQPTSPKFGTEIESSKQTESRAPLSPVSSPAFSISSKLPTSPKSPKEKSTAPTSPTTSSLTSPTSPRSPKGKSHPERILGRRPGKLQVKATWPEAKPSSLMERRGNRPNLLIQCSSSNTPAASTVEYTSCSPVGIRESFFDSYSLGQVLGRGSMGVVRRAVRTNDGKQVAVKMMSSQDPETVLVAKQEFELLRSISHPFIVKAVEIFMEVTCTLLVLEHFEGRTLEEAVKWSPNQSFSEAEAALLFVELLQALAHVHKMRIVHRDVKPQNMIVSADLQDMRLLDFNSARRQQLEGFALTPTGTCLYAAPEVVGGRAPSASSDVWSAGLCCHLMLVGKLPQARAQRWNFETFQKEATSREVSFSSSRWQQISEPFKCALRHCLTLDDQRRPSAEDLLSQERFRVAINAVSTRLNAVPSS